MFSVCPHLGGYPYPIMLCNITQNGMGQTPRGGTLPGPARGGTLLGVPCPGGYPHRVPPGQVRTGGTLPGEAQVGYPPIPRPGQDRGRGYPAQGGTQLGQQKEYSLHSRRYASCVHAGGLSCFFCRRWEHIRSEMKIRKVIAAEQEALTELRAISEDLYQQAIQVGIHSYNF